MLGPDQNMCLDCCISIYAMLAILRSVLVRWLVVRSWLSVLVGGSVSDIPVHARMDVVQVQDPSQDGPHIGISCRELVGSSRGKWCVTGFLPMAGNQPKSVRRMPTNCFSQSVPILVVPLLFYG